MPEPRKHPKRRVKGLPEVRLPLPKKPHQRHEDRRMKPPKHKKQILGE